MYSYSGSADLFLQHGAEVDLATNVRLEKNEKLLIIALPCLLDRGVRLNIHDKVYHSTTISSIIIVCSK